MPSSSKTLKLLENYLEEIKDVFVETQPEAMSWLSQQNISLDSFVDHYPATVDDQVDSRISKLSSSSIGTITSLEKQAIFEKLTQAALEPPQQLSGTNALYLEQQLSDLLGITLSTELDGYRLPHNVGVMLSSSHLERVPSDKLEKHEAYLEAGIDKGRSQFGWFLPKPDEQDDNFIFEKYFVGAQLQYLEEWQSNRKTLKEWYKYRKVLVVNPFNLRATVASIARVGPTERLQHQFLGSPEVIRETMIWSPKAQGKVLMFFVDDPDNEVELGSRNLG